MMDRPQPVTRELERDLENLRKLNIWFGSHRLVRGFLRRWLRPGSRARVLDLATGSADIPRMMAAWARAHGIRLEIDAVDAHPSTLSVARSRSALFPEINLVEADALSFAPSEPYDIVCCSLALHHFSEEDAVVLLRRCRELARGHVLVADLARSVPALIGIHALTATFFREPMTKFDARMSIRRAFSFSELEAMAMRAGWREFGHERFPIARQAIWM